MVVVSLTHVAFPDHSLHPKTVAPPAGALRASHGLVWNSPLPRAGHVSDQA